MKLISPNNRASLIAPTGKPSGKSKPGANKAGRANDSADSKAKGAKGKGRGRGNQDHKGKGQAGKSLRDSHPPCRHCGLTNHTVADCIWQQRNCPNCGRKGHTTRVCRQPRGGAHDPNASSKASGSNAADSSNKNTAAAKPPAKPPNAANQSPRLKQPCFKFADGQCDKGDMCPFRHHPPMTEAEKAARLKGRTPSPKGPPPKATAADRSPSRKPLCTNFQKDQTCKYGDKCHFVHLGRLTLGDPKGTVAAASAKPKRTRSRSTQRKKKAPPAGVAEADAEKVATKPPAVAK